MTSGDALVERELRDARAREADYRARLARHRNLSAKLRAHAALLREALRNPAPGGSIIARLLADVARLSSQALEIPRASIWLFDESRQYLVCRFQLPLPDVHAPPDGPRIATASCPGYISALAKTDSGAVAVDDAWHDPRTSELGAYLRANDVGALLDIPIVGPGALHGVLCHEHQGGPRSWQEEEIDFATDVGAMVALALEAERRIHAEQTARGAAARYQHLVESLPVTVYSFQAKTGQLDYLSPRIVELGGRGAEQYLVSGGIERWVEAIEPEDRAPVRQRLSGSIIEGFIEELTYRIRMPDGARRWVRDTCSVVRDATGRPIAVQGTLADVTRLREAELARAEIERRYRTLLENADLPAAILAATGRVEFVNDCFTRLTGFTRDECLGADVFDLIFPPDERERVREDFLASIRRGEIVPRFESTIRTRNGSRRKLLWTNTLIRASDSTVVGSCSLGVDITDRLAAEVSQLEHQKLESLGRLAAGVAHDFNNLLMVLSGAVSTLREPRSAPAERASALVEIDGAVGQATALTRQLLTYARREAIAPALLSVDAVVQSTLPVLSKLVGPELRLSHRLGAGQARVVVDEAQLRQVLLNLVGNAADATRGHGSEVRISTDLVVLEPDQVRARGIVTDGTFVVLTVADDGNGIPGDLAERVFDPFFTTKGKGQGTGLGLAMCESIVRRAGGFIAIESVAERGATVRAHFPVAETEAPRVAPSLVERPGVASLSGRPRVLVVEDNEPIRTLVVRVLADEGVELLEAASLGAARAALAGTNVDVLLADGELPDGSGIELAREAVERGQARRVILMSGAEVSVGRAAFIDAVVPKPFRLDGLVESVKRLLPSS